ncbi:MAG: tRNA (adenosine(37)-N6)-threonylcarbamoyltransferase complex ATPase subunit type 1 TsaE [Alphaproteobacteria bacterium]|nr:tRNA (adenosine(37)-N6)-threonylcarbamoyltransferase complex ATPase subunit type 1 TsaE [Alphaproteobacteria bacterium]MCW5741443.1 tRNA (adenosine(37)-N6)-threonylcarbamoyltransferase complex ATPase subunit type 1 TsaE [Alphaproteobacteria bacterium]
MSGPSRSDIALALPDLAATRRLGAALSRRLAIGDVVALHGDLGAGKTELARAIIRAAAEHPELTVPSPTFTLAETYDTALGPIWHFDLYRLDAPEQVWELGFEEALAGGISLIEWPERLGALLPARRLDVTLTIERDEARAAALAAGASWADRLAELGREVAHG